MTGSPCPYRLLGLTVIRRGSPSQIRFAGREGGEERILFFLFLCFSVAHRYTGGRYAHQRGAVWPTTPP